MVSKEVWEKVSGLFSGPRSGTTEGRKINLTPFPHCNHADQPLNRACSKWAPIGTEKAGKSARARSERPATLDPACREQLFAAN